MNNVIHINGWPGSGKRSIGQILATQIGGRLLDNHAMLNPAEALFSRFDPLHRELHRAVRDITLDYAANCRPRWRSFSPIRSATMWWIRRCSSASVPWRRNARRGSLR